MWGVGGGVCRQTFSFVKVVSKRVLPWQVSMYQLVCASLSHTHYWYEVGMLKLLVDIWLIIDGLNSHINKLM